MKYKENRKKLNKKSLLIITGSVVTLVLIVGLLESSNITRFFTPKKTGADNYNSPLTTKIDNNPPTKEQIDAGNNTKSGSTSDTPPEPTPIQDSDKKSVQVAITAANQNGSLLQIRALISAVETTGTCTLTLTNTQNNTVTKAAGVQALATTSTCQGFDILISELSTGSWHIDLEYSNDSLTGTATQDVVIK
jgi:hypothetical protein